MNTDTSQRRVLHWVLAVTAVFLFFSTLATVGVIWWMRKSASTKPSALTTPSSSAANWSRATFTANAGHGVRQTSDKSWSIKGGRAFMNVRRKDDDSFELRFVYPFDSDFLPQETIALVRARWGLREVEKLAPELSITEEQLAALKAVSPATDIPVSAPDKERMRSLFEDYLATKDAAAEKGLIEAVAEIDTNYGERTRERIEGIAAKVKTIFNEDQWAALSGRFDSRHR
jgi:hypothetical protein